MRKASSSLQDLRRRLYVKAKTEGSWRFWGLYVHVCQRETLREAYRLAKRNNGAPGIDGVTALRLRPIKRSSDLKAPDHTTLSRRNQIVVVPPLTRAHDRPIDLIVDSTGLKILGRGEWNAHKHKASKKRRDWRKLHIGVDAKGFIDCGGRTHSEQPGRRLHTP